MLYILDTDQVSLLQRGNLTVSTNLARINLLDRAVTIITAAEQTQGRLASISRAKTEEEAARGFTRLAETLLFYQIVQILPYDAAAVTEFERLRVEKIRIGTQDLRIAAIALSRKASGVTRNLRDFGQVPTLQIVDWSLPIT